MSDVPLHPSDLIKQRLADLHMSQVECAKRMGITPKHINQICQKVVDAISPELALKFERVLQIPMALMLVTSAEYRSHFFRLSLQPEEGQPCEGADE